MMIKQLLVTNRLRIVPLPLVPEGKIERVRHDYAQARPGERIFDVGCGVVAVATFFRDVVYHGVTSNEASIGNAHQNMVTKRSSSTAKLGRTFQLRRSATIS